MTKELIHSNIVEHKYFMKHQDGDTVEYSTIMELMTGKDMYTYIM